jgi:hypothetical protein
MTDVYLLVIEPGVISIVKALELIFYVLSGTYAAPHFGISQAGRSGIFMHSIPRQSMLPAGKMPQGRSKNNAGLARFRQ